jgi:hypothetical protein
MIGHRLLTWCPETTVDVLFCGRRIMTEERPAKRTNTAPVTQWEYETLLIGNDKLALSPALARVATAGPRPWPGTPFEDALNELGRKGWELVGIANIAGNAQTLAVFKRPLA